MTDHSHDSAAQILSAIDADAALRPQGAVELLCSTTEIRRRAAALLDRARAGGSEFFAVDDAALDAAAGIVADVTRENYPDGTIPLHSRWRHLGAGGVDRRAALDHLLGDRASPVQRARAQFDLTLVSVLLDAGAGDGWRYAESASGQTFARSEGLGVASFHAFTAGLFSSDPAHPCQVDAAGLRGLATDHLAQAFQVRDNNPLVGLGGRATLLRRLGETMASRPESFGTAGRPAGLFDLMTDADHHDIPPTKEIHAHDLLTTLLITLSPIWPTDNRIGDRPLGDCWRHPAVAGPGLTDGWMPFHKLTQWLTYSLIEPLHWAGARVNGLETLTGLPEYRNGGLLLDAGVLQLRDPALAEQLWKPADPLIVEWRALTVALLDELAPRVRQRLGVSAEAMPLACVLEGGTWAAGRKIAHERRGGRPPLQIDSDGTVF
ncbi:URC4/urg3 family protein [uncultured Xylophilus sp.]|uniref:URC4/urg3 family protein n=1 Tax=uncultured Xylophilus sp. TaxID=296832 RepID=UPI0025DD7589|nr:URC4/urg3 family protein [uncultured Xylophilus sp.]